MRTLDLIDPKIAGTIPGLFRERVKRTPKACAYLRFSEKENRFEEIPWEQILDRAACWQAALEREGLQLGDRVAVMLRNCLEWVLFDLAALGLGLVTVPLFADDRPENAAHILKETGSRFVLIEEAEQWARIQMPDDPLPRVDRIVALHSISHRKLYSNKTTDADRGDSNQANADRQSGMDSERDRRLFGLAEWLPETRAAYIVKCSESTELATIVYTSGTMGMPKGVMLSHSNILENASACLQRESIYPDDLFLSFLPLSHSFERTVGYYIPMMAGACVAHVRSIDKLSEDLLAVRPTVLTSVPRIYERIHKKIVAGLEQKSSLVRQLFHLTVHTGWKRFLYLQGRRRWTPLFLLWPILYRIVASQLIANLGGRLRTSISGGASLAFPITQVFIGLGLNLLQGYGLTETSPVISVNTTNDNVPDTVGCPLPGVDSVIAASGELWVRGPNVMLGYWQNREATKAAIDADGYLHTGDLARLDESGHIRIVGRLKEIIVLSTGNKVSPGDIELSIGVNPLFEQVMVLGEDRPYLAALVVLNPLQWKKVAASHGIASDRLDLLHSNRVKDILLSEIARRTNHFPDYAQIRRVHATISPWSVQNGLVTATLKLRRKELRARFEQEVESLFKEH
jgi:long-chain acyl-CoA synthetase